jgi:hypothetical protein
MFLQSNLISGIKMQEAIISDMIYPKENIAKQLINQNFQSVV